MKNRAVFWYSIGVLCISFCLFAPGKASWFGIGRSMLSKAYGYRAYGYRPMRLAGLAAGITGFGALVSSPKVFAQAPVWQGKDGLYGRTHFIKISSSSGKLRWSPASSRKSICTMTSSGEVAIKLDSKKQHSVAILRLNNGNKTQKVCVNFNGIDWGPGNIKEETEGRTCVEALDGGMLEVEPEFGISLFAGLGFNPDIWGTILGRGYTSVETFDDIDLTGTPTE